MELTYEATIWVQVLVDAPSHCRTYTYRLAPGMAVASGDVVSVPFGSQRMGGIVLSCSESLPRDLDASQIKTVEEVLGAGFLPSSFWQILEQVAEYYLAPLARVIETALPPGLLSRSQRRIRLAKQSNPMAEWGLSQDGKALLEFLSAQKEPHTSWRFLQQRVPRARLGLTDLLRRGLVESYLVAPEPPRVRTQQVVTLVNNEPEGLTSRQVAVLHALRQFGGEATVESFVTEAHTTRSLLGTLHKLGRVRLHERIMQRGAVPLAAPDRPKALMPEQQIVLERLQETKTGAVLIQGVTGSGKTEVYLQAIAPVLARGESALVLVPEIGLTPQLTDRFTARFGAQVLVYHSALSEGERYDTWRTMLTSEPQVVIGTRSAIFAPLPKLGLIILDEEHDSSYKQDRPAPCYHARTVALWRSEICGCPLLLGSATPDSESYQRSQSGEYLHLQLTKRVAERPMPGVEVVDMREELADGNLSPFSRRLQHALTEMKEAGKQGILFINRRGYSTFVMCRSCGETLRCPNCTVSLTYHRLPTGEHLRCHYCNYSRSQPRNCPECTSPSLRYFGAGTQRIAAQIEEILPDLRILRFDRDTTSRKNAHRQIIDQFAQGEADVLVGTQMLAKGLDLPQVTLVGILAADGLLNMPDFRASERAFQLLTQVAGRAGRGDDLGRVILQTYAPDHPVVEATCTYRFEHFIEKELEERQALNYPPFVQLIALQLTGVHEGRVIAVAEALATILDGSADFEGNILGPAPCTIERVAGRYRWQLLLKNPSGSQGRHRLQELLSGFSPQTGVSIAVDVDPLRLL
jgi:primosomal protein N' (replication factor Y) (superfamily II helicase)